MRQGFEGAMRDYGEMAKQNKDLQEKRRDPKNGVEAFYVVQKQLDKLEGVIEWHKEQRSGRTDSGTDAQNEIFSLQVKKQEVMDRLKKEIAMLDMPDAKFERPADARMVIAKEDALFVVSEDGTETEATLGELVTDGVWGVEYHADPETVPRVMQKRLLVERAKREIEEMLDEQIITEEVASGRVHPMLKEAYAAIRERRELEQLPHGVIAEKMTAQLVRKKILDEDAPFSYESGDVFQDVVRKIDFVIRRSDYGRGVRVEGDEDLGAKAVQLTVNKDPQALARKRSQIEKTRTKLEEGDRIDDIALVQFDQHTVARAFRAWEGAKRPPGGPDKFLTPEVRDRMFTELVAGMGE